MAKCKSLVNVGCVNDDVLIILGPSSFLLLEQAQNEE